MNYGNILQDVVSNNDSMTVPNHVFTLLSSGRRYQSWKARTERLKRSFFPQAIRYLNGTD